MDKSNKQALLSVEEMYLADQKTITSGISGTQLMENAGAGLEREIIKRWSPRKTVILCGPGNNGGDGFVLARRLSRRGWFVRILLLGKKEDLKDDAAHHAAKWNFEIFPFEEKHILDAKLIVDAVFGAGLSRPIEGNLKNLLAKCQKLNVPIIGVDVPSGIDGNTGQCLGYALKCDLTVTFARKKTGHLLYPAKEYCGEIKVIDIAIPDKVILEIQPSTFENSPEIWINHFPKIENETHKYKRGHGVIIGGAMTGATRLAAQNARRIGAGLLTIKSSGTPSLIYRNAEPGLIISNAPLEEHLSDKRKNAYLIGPGLGVGDTQKENLESLWKSECALVVDADGLNNLSEMNLEKRTDPLILTPHEGEFKKLFPNISGSKLEKTKQAAKQINAIVIYKGPDTVIASPDGKAVINSNAPATLATAGTGDCLAGLCLGLLCQNVSPFYAACIAVWVHGECANLSGAGLIAEDLAVNIPAVIEKLDNFWTDHG